MISSRLTRLRITGFRSLKEVEITDLSAATVLIGPNGSGKSNVLAALQMVRLLAFESLQLFVGRQGGATSLMHYGPKTTPIIDVTLEFETAKGQNAYACRLGHAADDSLLFLDERAGYLSKDDAEWLWIELGAGHRESRLKDADDDTTVRTTRWLLRQLNFFHFHDTSMSSALRTNSKAEDDRILRSDGSNLAAFLLALKTSAEPSRLAAYRRIEGLVKQIAPFIRELDPAPVGRTNVRLDWLDDRGELFGPAHLSDGTLRAIALFTALGQPKESLPLLVAIDEPELGLHPAALHLFAELVRSASANCQVILATQSPGLLDEFEATEVRIAERKDYATELRGIDSQSLEAWLNDFALSELYDKNLLGGRP